MTVDAVIADVDFATDEPLSMRLFPDQHLVPFLEPVELLGLLGPETFRVILGLRPELFVFRQALDVRLGGEVRGRRKFASLLEDARDIGCGSGHVLVLLAS